MSFTDKIPTPEEFAKAAQEHGWLAHMVFDDCSAPYHWNVHTHGLVENFMHPDLQICMPLQGKQFGFILHGIVDLIRKGKVFQAGDISSDVLEGFDVEFIDATECGRPVLRVCLPDKHGRFRDGEFAEQYTKLTTG